MNAIKNIMSRKKEIISVIFNLVQDPDLAEELFSRTIVKINDAINRGSYQDLGFEIYWAKRVAHNVCIDHFRSHKRKKVYFTQFENEENFIHHENFENEIVKSEVNKSQFEEITKCLDLLPAEQREIVVLRFYAGMSFKEIARVANISINTALGRMRYALRNMRKTIEFSGEYNEA